MSTTAKPAHNTTGLTDGELIVLWGDGYGELPDGYILEDIRCALNRHVGHEFDLEFVDRMRVQMLYGNFPDFWRTPAWIEWKIRCQKEAANRAAGDTGLDGATPKSAGSSPS
ncbi:hypothetical protein BC567DRAFT_259492 [Phyllosticta citribraziliensis]